MSPFTEETHLEAMSGKSALEDQVERPSDNVRLDEESFGFHFDSALDRTAVFRLDLLMQPILFGTFVFLLLDRANVGNARVAGLQKTLKLTDNEYQICMSLERFL